MQDSVNEKYENVLESGNPNYSEELLCRVLNAKGVSDVGHVEFYISETVQDTASGTIND